MMMMLLLCHTRARTLNLGRTCFPYAFRFNSSADENSTCSMGSRQKLLTTVKHHICGLRCAAYTMANKIFSHQEEMVLDWIVADSMRFSFIRADLKLHIQVCGVYTVVVYILGDITSPSGKYVKISLFLVSSAISIQAVMIHHTKCNTKWERIRMCVFGETELVEKGRLRKANPFGSKEFSIRRLLN